MASPEINPDNRAYALHSGLPQRKELIMMRRFLVPLGVAALAVAPVTALAAGSKSVHHFTDHLLGAEVLSQGSTSTWAYKVTTSDNGPGAGVTINTSTSSTGGKTRGSLYFANGSIKDSGTYQIGTVSTNGLVPVTVKGKESGGTGIFKAAHGSFKGTGTDNPKTNQVTLTVTGTLIGFR